MKNAPFTYHRPESLASAINLLREFGGDAKVLAGGQSLLPTIALRLGPPEHVIDIGTIPGLADITEQTDGSITIGALVRHMAAENSAIVASKAPLVSQAMPHVGHRAIRTRGTVVGSVAHADPAAEMPAVCLATNAVVHAASATGTRDIPAADFFQGYLTTALRDDEIATGVTFRSWPAFAGSALVEVGRRHGDYAMVGLACTIEVQSDTISAASLVFFGVGAVPVRATAAEATLIGQAPSPESFEQAAVAVRGNLETSADLHATANYRRHVAGVLTTQGLAAATAAIGASV